MQEQTPEPAVAEALADVAQKGVNVGKSKAPRIKMPTMPALQYSFHDLDKRKTLLVMQLRMQAVAQRWTSEQYTTAVKKALKSLYVTHARATGNLNKYGGHDGTPGYRNPNYLWDHLTLGADNLPVPNKGEETGQHPLDSALETALQSEPAQEVQAQTTSETEKGE